MIEGNPPPTHQNLSRCQFRFTQFRALPSWFQQQKYLSDSILRPPTTQKFGSAFPTQNRLQIHPSQKLFFPPPQKKIRLQKPLPGIKHTEVLMAVMDNQTPSGVLEVIKMAKLQKMINTISIKPQGASRDWTFLFDKKIWNKVFFVWEKLLFVSQNSGFYQKKLMGWWRWNRGVSFLF